MTTMTCLDQYIDNEFAAKVKQRTIIIEREEVGAGTMLIMLRFDPRRRKVHLCL